VLLLVTRLEVATGELIPSPAFSMPVPALLLPPFAARRARLASASDWARFSSSSRLSSSLAALSLAAPTLAE